MLKTIGICGGSGLVGKHLTERLLKTGNNVVIFSRSGAKSGEEKQLSYAHWDPAQLECDVKALGKLDAMVQLAGAGIADKRWTTKRKKEILDSRIDGTRFLVSQLKLNAPNCKTFVAASAIGYYGPDNKSHSPFREDAPAYDDFLGETCRAWEDESKNAYSFLRTIIFRFGIVLAKEAGAFPKFLQPVKLGAMPILGSGEQIISWIHVDDLSEMILIALENNNMQGIYNAVSPYPVSNKEMMQAICKEKGGLSIPFHVPTFLLKAILGEMSIEVLKSCTVSAEKILSTGFSFQYPVIDKAVRDLVRPNATQA